MRLVGLTRARASFYGFLNIHFMQLPDAPFVCALRDKAFGAVLKDLELSSDVHPEIAEGASLMRAYLESTKAFNDAELAERLGLDRTRLYRGVSPHYGPPPPFEALWIGEGETSGVLPEMAKIYARSGFNLKPDVHERLDYIGIQMNYLEGEVMNEISLREAGDKEMVHMALGRERAFLWNHLGEWVPRFVLNARDHAQTDFYRGHLHMLNGFIEQEKDALVNCQ